MLQPKFRSYARYLSMDQLNHQALTHNDIWQFACVMLEFSTGELPFYKYNNASSVDKIKSGENPLADYVECLNVKKLQRPGHNFKDVLDLYPELKEMLYECFNLHPEAKNVAKTIAAMPFFKI